MKSQILAAILWTGASLAYATAGSSSDDLMSRNGPVVAITFDDLPYANVRTPTHAAEAVEAQRRIVQALRNARVPATGFVNEDKVEAFGTAGPQMLVDWNTGLLTLGNHGYSHFDSNEISLDAIKREIVKGEATIGPMAASVGRKIRFFRFPYNHVGDTEAKRSAIETLLGELGYKLAASTIDTSDYIFNDAYERAFNSHDMEMMLRIEETYLDYSRVQVTYYGDLGLKIFGREIPAIMLLHANRLNAATIEPLLELLRSAGYEFVSLAQAQADPAYSSMPAVATKFGPMWAYRWARERQVTIDGRLEKEPPTWIGNYANE